MFKCLYLLAGRSGAGKFEIRNALCRILEMKPVISYSSKKPLPYEVNDYVFISKEDFSTIKDIVALVEYADEYYCSDKHSIMTSDIYVIEPSGIDSVIAALGDKRACRVIYLSIPEDVAVSRLVQRGEERIGNKLIADSLFDQYMLYKSDLVVDDIILSNAVEKIISFILDTEDVLSN